MMDFETFKFIKKKYGPVAIWTVWKEQGIKSKSNNSVF